ncbi:MAG: nicotinate (nicotinamide) nucleotide adenylyltransferase [Desulfuromonas sp.]|nr:MAG: nicotinate (nicotinamide) nucleotide adenylyltransferase [Desulfuromonas sp.]
MRIGLLGGTFNPIHYGHLHIAEEVMASCALDQVWFVPAYRPPHKALAGEVSYVDRLAMVRLAIAGDERFQVCTIEGERGGTSYSVETLEQLHERHPQYEFFFIMGLDSFQEIGLWREYPRLFDLANIVVTARPGFSGSLRELLPVAIAGRFCYDSDSKKLLCDSGFSLIAVTHTCRDISSTEVRQLLAARRDCEGKIPAAVIDYIQQHELYLC